MNLDALRQTMISMAGEEAGNKGFDTYIKLCAGEEVEGVEAVTLIPTSIEYKIDG